MDELMAEIQVPRDESSLIMVIGVGGAGCNAVSNMWHAGVKGVTYLACNTDRKSLNINPVSNKVRLGTEGLGAGNRPCITVAFWPEISIIRKQPAILKIKSLAYSAAAVGKCAAAGRCLHYE